MRGLFGARGVEGIAASEPVGGENGEVVQVDVDGDAGVVDGLHDGEPVVELGGRVVDGSGDEIAGKEEDVDAAVDDFVGEFGEDDAVYAVVGAATVAGYDEGPAMIGGIRRQGGGRQEDQD